MSPPTEYRPSLFVYAAQKATASHATKRADELAAKKKEVQSALDAAKQQVDALQGQKEDAKAEAEKKLKALNLDTTQLDKVRLAKMSLANATRALRWWNGGLSRDSEAEKEHARLPVLKEAL